jgi:hypothetical protein
MPKNFTNRHGIFKELSKDRGRADFAKNLRASLFNGSLRLVPLSAIDPSCCRVPLKGGIVMSFLNVKNI